MYINVFEKKMSYEENVREIIVEMRADYDLNAITSIRFQSIIYIYYNCIYSFFLLSNCISTDLLYVILIVFSFQ